MSYRIESHGNCIVVFEDVPMSKISTILHLAPKNSVMDCHAARIMGASLAIGPAHELRALARDNEKAAIARQRQRTPDLASDAIVWLAIGERGASSNTIFHCLTGVDVMEGTLWSVPVDLDDWRRCQLLLEQVTSIAPMFDRMQEESVEWLRLVSQWREIRAAMDLECLHWRHRGERLAAPRAQALLNEALARPQIRTVARRHLAAA